MDQSSQHLQHLYTEVPFHALFEKEVSDMNDKELEAFILTTRSQRVAPSERKKAKTTASKILSGKKSKTDCTEELTHLI